LWFTDKTGGLKQQKLGNFGNGYLVVEASNIQIWPSKLQLYSNCIRFSHP
jgi:hypothetical protein